MRWNWRWGMTFRSRHARRRHGETLASTNSRPIEMSGGRLNIRTHAVRWRNDGRPETTAAGLQRLAIIGARKHGGEALHTCEALRMRRGTFVRQPGC